MPKIKQLPPHEAQKIAAGQVVERPANIVKELVENSIDAGATAITIYIEDGGKKLIRIVDNGCGMDTADAQLCFVKHATSKISSMDELSSIATFGFRGEALASIAAVAKIILITKEHDAHAAIQLTVHDGIVHNIETTSAPTGTDITIHDLFYNVPARQKFLKQRETEWRHILQLFQACCLDYPQVHFTLFSEQKKVLNCPPVAELKQRFAQLWDQANVQHILNIQAENKAKGIKISGIISDHQTFRYDRNNIFFFVNNRWVKDFKLSNALIKGYMNVAPTGRYPNACISITVDPTLVDVNMHPRKEEVKFMHPQIIEQLIQSTVKTALEQHLSASIKRTVQFAPAIPAPSAPYTPPSYTPFNFDTFTEPANWKPQHQVISAHQSSAASISEPLAQLSTHSQLEQNITLPDTSAEHYEIIGQLHKTYILIQHEEGLFVVDQHAAHERILYEQFATRFEDIATVNLLFPEHITLSADDMRSIEPHLCILQNNGISVEPFGHNQLKIHATPVHIKNISMHELIKQVISWINESQNLDNEAFTKTLHEKIRAQMACKAAVKAGDVLTQEQMTQLLDDLQKTNNRLTCPHGRPTGWLLSLYDIEKKFKRKL
ncbi:MAG TPA: DNA mismatch repair endonuclease MutL [Candidatus Dependentiae bacterium]|nr:DNA mismatch repair endonuclease MutL [Candidatus Dependentiae bacterium]HRQ62872.1 DNA mismatch repair endonuclease MutL [Candidatus Dependentiae bacterium]